MTVKFTNNASTTVATAINTTATSLVVASAAGFPALSGSGDYCYLTIQQAAGTNVEVVKATALSSNTFTIVRAQDGTSAGSWSVSDVVELRVTAALLTDIVDAATHDSSVLAVDSTNNRVGVNDTTPSVTLDISGTDAIALPVGTTAERPTGAAGRFRYNSSLSQFEGYTDAWGAIGGGGTNTFTTDTFTANGSLVAFNLSQTVSSENNLLVFIDGVFQTQDAYAIATASGTTTLTFSAAPANARKIVVYSVAAGISGSNLNIDSMTGDGSDVTLTLSIAPVTINNTIVTIDGVYQAKANYSISGTTLTFSTAPPSGTAVEVMTFTQTEINVPVDNTITSAKLSGDLTTPGALTVTGEITANGGIALGDSDKATFGASDDLQIYHDGNHSYIEDAGTGSIKIKVGDFRVENASGNNLIKGVGDVATLHHAGSEKLATTSTGIDVTGTVTSSGPLQLTAGALAAAGNAGLSHRSADNKVYLQAGTGGFNILDDQQNTHFFIDSAGVSSFNNNVGIGVAPYSWSNLTALQLERASVSGGDPDTYFTSNGYYSTNAPSGWKYGSGTTATQMYMNASGGEFVFRNAASGTADAALTWSQRMTIDASGNVGIGTSSPDTTLHLQTPSGTKSEINFAQTAVTNYRIGVPASTDALVFTYGASTERMRIAESGAVTVTANTTSDWALAVSNGTNSNAFGLYVNAPSTSGIPLRVDGGGSERMRISSAGIVTTPYQPAFLANATGQDNIPIAANTVVIFGRERFDQGGNFASNTFTAPVTGAYQFDVNIYAQSIDSNAAYVQISLKTTLRQYYYIFSTTSLDQDAAYMVFPISVLANMDEGDTAYVEVQLNATGAAQMDINSISYFSGYLAA